MNNIGTIIQAPVRPATTDDNYPTHFASEGKGGYHVVNTLELRDLIPSLRREVGMTVYVVSEDKQYRLIGAITNDDWVVLTTSGDPTVFTRFNDVAAQMSVSMANNVLLADCPTYGKTTMTKVVLVGFFKPCTIHLYLVDDKGVEVLHETATLTEEVFDAQSIVFEITSLSGLVLTGSFVSVCYRCDAQFKFKGLIVTY